MLTMLIIVGLLTAGAYMFFIEGYEFKKEKAKIKTAFGCLTTTDNIEEFSSKQKLFRDARMPTQEQC